MVVKGDRKPCPCDYPLGRMPIMCGKPEDDDED